MNAAARGILNMSKALGLGSLARGAASRWPFPVIAKTRSGRRIYVDLRSSIGRGIYATGEFDPLAIEPVLRALTSGSVFFDVGANIGYYSLLALDRIGPGGRIVCFEMNDRPLRALRKTIALNGARNIEIEVAAVTDRDGVAHFVPTSEDGHGKINLARQGTRIPAISLDSYVDRHAVSRLDALKIDVEGAELLVLEGARRILATLRPVIAVEAVDSNSKAFDFRAKDIAEFLGAMRYRVEWLEGVHTPTIWARSGVTWNSSGPEHLTTGYRLLAPSVRDE